MLLEDLFYLSGEIPRVTPYERGLLSHMQRSGDGSSWEPDPWIMDERYVAAHIKNKGIIVFTACSHSGVINVLKDASSAFADVPLYAVMGGSISQYQVPKRSFRTPSMIFRPSG